MRAGLGDGHRPRGPLRAQDGHQAVLRLPQRLRRRAQHQRLPELPGPARVRSRCSTSRRWSWPWPSAPPCTATSGPRPSTGRTTSTRTRPRTTRSASTTSRSTSTATSTCPTGTGSASSGPTWRRTPARPPTPARRAASTAPTTRWSTTTARACRWSRSSAPPTCARRPGPGLRHRAAGHPGGLGRLRRQDGGGVDAGRRQRLGAAHRRRPLRHPLRDQEPQLGALARPGHRVRGRAPDRPDRVGRAGGPADPPLGRGGRPHPGPALQGGRLRLPVLPRARPGAAGARRRVDPGGGRHPRHDAGRAPGPSGRAARRRRGRHRRPAATRWPPWSTWASTTWWWRRWPAGSGTALALARTANEAATDAEAARPARPQGLRGAADPRVPGILSATQAKAVLAELFAQAAATRRPSPGRRASRPCPRTRWPRRWPRPSPPTPTSGPATARATTSWPGSSPGWS